MSGNLIWVSTPHNAATFGIILDDNDRVTDAAPIGRWLIGKTLLTPEEMDEFMRRLHHPVLDGPFSLITWPYCSCNTYETHMASDGYPSIGPTAYPCATMREYQERRAADG